MSDGFRRTIRALRKREEKERYGDFEMINGAIANGLNDKLNLLKREFGNLISAAVTVNVKNQREWMQWFEMKLNDYLEFLGDENRVKFNGENFSIINNTESALTCTACGEVQETHSEIVYSQGNRVCLDCKKKFIESDKIAFDNDMRFGRRFA